MNLLHSFKPLWLLVFFLLLSACSNVPVSNQEELITSSNDARQYRSLVLPNQLRVLLISDATTDKAAAALDINVGSSANPKNRQGLAHFLEHMLFLGTEKYPEPGEYQAFISEHGGSHNAYTAFEHTNYFFDIDSAHLEAALDRFSQFFVAPLFNENYVEREKHAVDSEYQSKRKDDFRRIYEVLKSAANPAHPFSEFFVGSLTTLEDRPDESVRDALLAFYQDYYSANLMTLVVLGKEPIEVLEQMVRARFAEVENRNRLRPDATEPLFLDQQLPMNISVAPVKELRQLSLMFPLPAMHSYYRQKPLAYIANLLGHEGEGSLTAYLKQAGWIESLSAGPGHEARDATLFNLSMELTQEGLAHRDEIIAAVFTAVEKIRAQGINLWRFSEQQQLARIEFEFKEKRAAIHEVTSLASQMQYYPAHEVLVAPYLYEQFDAALIEKLLDALVPHNMIRLLVAKEVKTEQESPWFNAPYALSHPSPAELERWTAEHAAIALDLPSANPFIPEQLALANPEQDGQRPEKMEIEPGLTLWHLQDTSFQAPRADFYFSLRSPLANDSAAHRLLTELYVKMVNDQLSSFSYPAYLAGLDYQLYRHVRGVSVRISGFQDKQSELLGRVTQLMASPTIDLTKFEQFKDELRRDLQNSAKDQPYRQAMERVSTLLMRSAWERNTLLAQLDQLTPQDLERFIPAFLSQIELVALANGNIDRAQALALTKQLAAPLHRGKSITRVQHQPIVKLPQSSPYLQALKLEHPDDALVVYHQGNNKSMSTAARFALFDQLLSAPYYHALRTEQQRGYIVFANSMTLMDVPATTFIIQSPNTAATDLLTHTRAFLNEFGQKVQDLSPVEFDKHKRALISRIMEKETRLAQKSARLWQEIDRENDRFDWREQLVAAIEAYPLSQFQMEFAAQFIEGESATLTILAQGQRFEAQANLAAGFQQVQTQADLPQTGH